MSKRVAITGYGTTSPLGADLDSNMDRIWQGSTEFKEIDSYNWRGSSVRYCGECAAPNLRALPNRKVAKILRRKDLISLLTCLKAAEHAGLKEAGYAPERIGMYVGAACTQIGDLTPYFQLVRECTNLDEGTFDSERFGQDLLELVNPLVVLQNLMNNTLCFGSMTLDIRGVNANFMDFQVSGLRAVGEGYRSIQSARAESILAGGVAAQVEPFHVAEGTRSGFLALTAEGDIDPSKTVRPFAKDRCGTILSDGSAFVVLEEWDHAQKRGATIHGELIAYDLASDGHSKLMNEPTSRGLIQTMRQNLAATGIRPRDVGTIIAHANGTTIMDEAEAHAYWEVFGEHLSTIPTSAPKSVTGDMAEASGVLHLIVALESFKRRSVPGTLNFTQGDTFSAKLNLNQESQPIERPIAMVTSRSFVGVSCSALVAGV